MKKYVNKENKGYIKIKDLKSIKLRSEINDILLRVKSDNTLKKYDNKEGVKLLIKDFREGTINSQIFNNAFQLIQFISHLYMMKEVNIYKLKTIHTRKINYANIFNEDFMDEENTNLEDDMEGVM